MSDNLENHTLELLRALRNDILSMRTDMHAEFKDVKLRLSGIESAVTKARGDSLSTQEDVYRQQSTIDRLVERIERIERRLELT